MSKDFLKIGIIGAGFIGEKHVEAYGYIPRVKVAAVADTRMEKARQLADRVGGRAYQNNADMFLNEELDAVDVCLPTTMHRDAVVEAVRAGLDVVVEKPFALDLDDIDIMIDEAQKKDRRIMVAHVCRFIPEYVFAKSVIDSGELGNPLFFGAWRESTTPNWSWNNWLHDRHLSGGTVMDLQIHDIDLSNWLLGQPRSFFAHEVMKPGKEGPSHIVSSIGYSHGAKASLEAGHLMPVSYPFTSGYRLVFEQGAIECQARDNERRTLNIFSDTECRVINDAELIKLPGNNPYAAELEHFAKCLLDGSDFKISVQEARLAVNTVRKLIESLTSGQKIDV